jgi:hypothetical protein
MFNILGSRARLMPPTMPKTRFNPVSKITVAPVALEIKGVETVTQLQQAEPTSPALSLQGYSQQSYMYQPGVLGRLPPGARGRMALQTMTGGQLIAPVLPNGGGGGSPEGGGGILPEPDVTIPFESNGTEVLETDYDDEMAITPEPLPEGSIESQEEAGKHLITPSLWEQVIAGGAMQQTVPVPDASMDVAQAVDVAQEGMTGYEGSIIPSETVLEPSMSYRDLVGAITFNVCNHNLQPMNIDVLVSAMYGEWELMRTSIRAQLGPKKSHQYIAEFTVVGDVTDLWETLRNDANPRLTLDAVVQWRAFRVSTSSTKLVQLTLPG